jgi:selenide,water dikinase
MTACDLFALCDDCGCAAKIPAGTLSSMLKDLDVSSGGQVLVGADTLDDAGVFALDERTTLVQTVDFFPPVARDPETYGAIAAANALSDIYAMGGTPATALAIVAFPAKRLPGEVLAAIMRGAAAVLRETGTVLLGGHSVVDPHPKFGLAVTGTIDRTRILANAGARPGDRLILTKPLGTGVTIMAVKAGLAEAGHEDEANRSMRSLNRTAARLALAHGVHACTDITGFGLLGHAWQLAKASGVSLRIDASALPLLGGALGYARLGLLPGAAYANRDYCAARVRLDPTLPLELQDLLVDPQTSGGLLLACPPERAAALLADLRAGLDTACADIGQVAEAQPGHDLIITGATA